MKKAKLKQQLVFEEFVDNHNGVKDLLTQEELKSYYDLEYPTNVSILYDALKLHIEKYPDYELWVPLIYISWGVYKKEECQYITNHYQFISSKGRFVNLRGHKSKGKHTWYDKDGYRNVTLMLENINKTYTTTGIHRLVATAFIPRPEHLKNIPYTELEVNHDDGVKDNNNFNNLERCTRQENVKHSFDHKLKKSIIGLDNYLTKPLIGICTLKDYKGKEILLAGKKAIKALGLNHSKILTCAKLGRGISHGCTWRYATVDDIINHNNVNYDLNFITALKKHVTYLKGGIEGTHLTTNHKVLFAGNKDMKKQGFDPGNVFNVVNGKLNHYKGYIFKRISLENIDRRKKQIEKHNQTLLNQ